MSAIERGNANPTPVDINNVSALVAAIALALDLQTWLTLVRQQGLDDDRAVEMMVGMVRCLVRN